MGIIHQINGTAITRDTRATGISRMRMKSTSYLRIPTAVLPTDGKGKSANQLIRSGDEATPLDGLVGCGWYARKPNDFRAIHIDFAALRYFSNMHM